ncbi:MAG: hypothetical protein PVI83_04565, partial [Lysobacterales bacterium]
MRYAIWKSMLTVVLGTLLMAPNNAQSAEACNAYVDLYGLEGPDTVFEGDRLTLKTKIGAGKITDSTLRVAPWIDISGVAFGMDCGGGPMSELADCTAVGHTVVYHGVSDTNCVTPDGDAAFIVPESDNIIAIPVVGGNVVRMRYLEGQGGQTCNMDLDFTVSALHESTSQ